MFAGLLFLVAYSANAALLFDREQFFIDPKYDYFSRSQISATLRKISSHANWYIGDDYWNSLSAFGQSQYLQKLDALAQEFDAIIYPQETSFWGAEPNPGVDNDPRLVVLLTRLNDNIGGYFDTSHINLRTRIASSNEHEVLFINADAVLSNRAKIFIAHEFQHLISLNQKNLLRNLEDDIWLNEARSEYAVTKLGYDLPYSSSNLRLRVQAFLQNPDDSLTEWKNLSADYGVVVMFINYLVDRFGDRILVDSLQSGEIGLSSLASALSRNGINQSIEELFADWLATLVLNIPDAPPIFRYRNQNLTAVRIIPANSYILTSGGSLQLSEFIKDWQPNWYAFRANGERMYFSVSSPDGPNSFRGALLIHRTVGDYEVRFLNFGALPNFNLTDLDTVQELILMPFSIQKRSGFSENEPVRAFNLKVNVDPALPEGDSIQTISSESVIDGDLIRLIGSQDIYVVSGSYKRLLLPEIIAFYGHLTGSRIKEVDARTFFSYEASVLVRYVNDPKVYAVWPDGSKHWLNITPRQFEVSHRKWNSIFIVNEKEINFYREGDRITK